MLQVRTLWKERKKRFMLWFSNKKVWRGGLKTDMCATAKQKVNLSWPKKELFTCLGRFSYLFTSRTREKTKHTRFIFISNTFISNAMLKLAKNQANLKHHPEAELLLFENYSHSSWTLSSKDNKTYSKK